MVNKKGAFTSYEEIESLFKYQCDPSSRIYSEVQSKIKEIKERNVTNKLEQHFKKMAINGSKSKIEDERVENQSIKKKVECKMYNPLIAPRSGDQAVPFSSSLRNTTFSTPQAERRMEPRQDSKYLGKRYEPITPNYSYFKQKNK